MQAEFLFPENDPTSTSLEDVFASHRAAELARAEATYLSMANKAYDYQKATVPAFLEWLESQEVEALIALATGMGKTFTASLCLIECIKRGMRILWVTHRDELLEQSASTLRDTLCCEVDIEQAERKVGYSSRVVVASIQTLKGKRLQTFTRRFTPHIIVFDEAHHSLARTWMQVKMAYHEAKVLNLTATPYRQDISKRLSLGRILVEKNTSDGIKAGFLVPPKLIGTLKLELDNANVALGDYTSESLAAILMLPKVLQECVTQITTHLPGRRCIVFAANIEHGQTLAAELRKAGIKRVFEVYGETPKETRRQYYQEVRENPNSVIVNNLCLTEGFDLPALDFVAMLRPTKDAALYLQCIGRGLRTAKGKTDCIILDAIDAKKKTVGKSSLILPSEDDIRKESAFLGRPMSPLHVFLSWFYSKADLELEGQREQIEAKRSKLNTAERILDALFPSLERKWLPSQQRAMPKLKELLAESSPGKDVLSVFSHLTGTRHIEAFVKILCDNDWVYCPHRKLPKKEELDATQAEIAQLQEPKDSEDETDDDVSLSVVAKLDPHLRNFLLNVLGGTASLKEQAEEYYEQHLVEEKPVVWFKPIGLDKALPPITFIQHCEDATKLARFWVRDKEGTIYYFEQDQTKGFKAPLLNKELASPLYETLPDYVKSTHWAKQGMSPKQEALVKGILKIPDEDFAQLKISRLSASALITSHYSERSLRKLQAVVAGLAMAKRRLTAQAQPPSVPAT